ncbi:hypothetical protein [Haloarcula sp. 1CSR25-25]|nr:hypothetical protein [Haloarcula sp. 1CSR25-25]
MTTRPLSCPADGALLCACADGHRFECLRCHTVWRPEEVVPDV